MGALTGVSQGTRPGTLATLRATIPWPWPLPRQEVLAAIITLRTNAMQLSNCLEHKFISCCYSCLVLKFSASFIILGTCQGLFLFSSVEQPLPKTLLLTPGTVCPRAPAAPHCAVVLNHRWPQSSLTTAQGNHLCACLV